MTRYAAAGLASAGEGGEAGGCARRRTLRKRRSLDRQERRREDLAAFYEAAARSENVLVFSGSGVSAASGMSTFTSRGGLYERARKRFKVSDGIKLFSNSFHQRHPAKCKQFLAEIFLEAQHKKPNASHESLAELERKGRLLRHYTMNIDGLMGLTAASAWTGAAGCAGKTVELHGNCRQVVCTSCGAVAAMTAARAQAFKKGAEVRCPECARPTARPKIMLYDDDDAELITPDRVMDILEADVATSDLILWVGISFEQSASLEYFRNIQRVIKDAGREARVVQGILNPDPDSAFNAVSGSNNMDDLTVIALESHCQPVLAKLASLFPAPATGTTGATGGDREPSDAS